MKLYEQPLSLIEMDGRRYRLRLTYDRVLLAMDAATDSLLTDADKTAFMLGLLLRGRIPGRPARRTQLLQAILDLLQRDIREHDGPPLMSLTQDAPLIHAAFRQAYGIDLHRVSLPWVTFRDLLSGIPGNTRFGEVVALRARPVPPPNKHNAKEREQLLKAKAAVALELTEAQQRKQYQQSAAKAGRAILAWARRMQKGGAGHD